MAAGLIEPSKGEVRLDGQRVQGPGRDRGVVFQQDALFMWRTVIKNVEYGLEIQNVPKRERRERARRWLLTVGLENFADFYPKELSGGMKKRCQIATVLANEPEVLLMDEPFGALDYPTKCQLQEELVRILAEQPKTTLFVTHDIEEALFLADRIIAMQRGAVAEVYRVPFAKPRRTALRFSTDFAEEKSRLWGYVGADHPTATESSLAHAHPETR